MKKRALFFILAAGVCSSPCLNQTKEGGGRAWSVRIAGSFMAQHPDSITYHDEAKSARWNYEQGLMMEAFYQLWRYTGNSHYLQYVRQNLDHYVQQDGGISTYKVGDFNLDNIGPGRTVIRMFEQTHEEKYRKAADLLRSQLRDQPRTHDGGFWHKKIYPYQMWLDGLYMSEPFYALYARTFGDTSAYKDIGHQFMLIRTHLRDPRTGLYFHGWDESHQQAWADKVTGRSPNFWGRSIGWLSMALVDVLEILPRNRPEGMELRNMLGDLAASLWKERDPATNLWYQVVDQPGRAGNYLEASASSMFAYVFAKGARLGYLPAEYADHAADIFKGILKNFVTVDGKTIYLHHVVQVGGLGGKPYRDGSFAYYVGEPQRTNDFKGYGAFLLAAIEIERSGRSAVQGK